MAEPAPKLPEELQPDIRPDLRVLEGGGETTPRSRDHLRAADSSTISPEDIAAKEQSPGAPEGNKSDAKEADKLKDEDGLFNANKDKRGRLGRSLRRLSRRQKVIGGGLAGLGVGGVIATLIGISSGPLEFIHLAQLLTGFHHSVNEDQGDIKTGRLLRYLRDTSKPENIRMSKLGNKFTDKFEARMNATGLKSTYTPLFGFTDGVVIDKDNPRYAGLSEDEIRKKAAATYGIPEKDIKGTLKDGLKIEGKAFDGVGKSRAANRFYRSALKEAGYGKISSWIGARALTKRAGVTWHPISKLDQKALGSAEARLKAWREKRTEQIEKGTKGPVLTGASTDKDSNGNSSTDADGAADAANEIINEATDAANAEPGDKTKLENLKGVLRSKFTAGGAGIVGLACTAKAFNETYDDMKQTAIILPLIRAGMAAIAMGSQLQDGEDIDLEEYGFVHDLMYGENGEGEVSSWIDAASVQAELGGSGGYEPDSTLTKIGKGSPFDFLNTDGVKQLMGGACSKVGQGILLGISFATGPIATSLNLLGGAVFGPVFMNTLAKLLIGSPVDPLATGSDYGNQVNFGSFLAANDIAISSGGAKLTTDEETSLKTTSNELRDEEFRSHSLAYRMFAAKDYRSLAGQVIDKAGPSPERSLQNLASDLLNFGSIFKKEVGSLTPRAKAGPVYDYGIPSYGFSEEDMQDEDFINPYKTAKKAVDIIEHTGGESSPLVQKAMKCFGVEIIKDGEGDWAVVPSGQSVSAYTDDYDHENCDDGSDDWRTIRMFITYSRTMESMACYEGDEVSCQINAGNKPWESNSGLKLGKLCNIGDDKLNESSGMAASVKHPGVVYTHNDEGNKIWAIEIETCKVLGTFTVDGTRADPDPEAIQVDHTSGKIWFGDIGNGHPGQTSSMTDKDPSLKHPMWPARIIVFDEPDQFSGNISKVQKYDVTYEGGMQNSEALLANPVTGQGYIINKFSNTTVYKLPGLIGSGQATKVNAQIVPWVTDASFTDNGKWVLVRYRTVSDPAPTSINVYNAETWQLAGTLPVPKVGQGESITVEKGGCSFLIGSEGTNSPIVRAEIPAQFGGGCIAQSNSGSAGGKLDLLNWKLTLPTGKEITQPQLATYKDAWYYPATDGAGQEFYVDSGNKDIGTTTHSSNPRSELREMKNGGKDEASWSSGSGTHRMLIKQKVTELSGRQHVVIGQIHDDQDDVTVFRLEKDQLWITDGDSTHGKLLGTVKLGQVITVGFDVSGGTIKYYYSPSGATNPPLVSYSQKKSFSKAYFKAGNYYQGGTDGGKSRVVILGLGVTHDGSMPNIGGNSPDSGGGTSSDGSVSASGFKWPISKSDYLPLSGCFRKPSGGVAGHTGIDVPVTNKPVYAVKAGTIVQSGGPGGDGGNYIIIDHGGGYYSNYQHLSKKLKTSGKVAAGEQIAVSGSTGFVTGPHLHLSITTKAGLDSRYAVSYSLDPLNFLPHDRNLGSCN